MSVELESLWGDDFAVKGDYEKAKTILAKIKSPKEISEMPVEKVISSKDILFEDKLRVIEENVTKILGHYKEDSICIYSREEFHDYVTAGIKNGVMSIDTETLGTRTDIDKPATDPFTCKIAGLCLYTPGQKHAYIPINHTDYKTGNRIEGQLTEEDVREEMTRLVEAKTFNIFQNGKFDYMVIYYTCGVKVPISWDTMIGSQCLNENESAGLKFQYRDKIDPEQGKYDLDKLFDLGHLDQYPPELFSLYAATDAYITYRLYEYQKKEFEKPGCEKLYNLFLDIEMPVVTVTSEMEMRGVAVDKELAKRLSDKFHKKLDELNLIIDKEMEMYKGIISDWRKTPEANYCPVVGGRKQKSLNEKLLDPVELTSATQLGILLYDVLKVLHLKKGDTKKTTDEDTLKSISGSLPLANMILQKREYEKYLGTYIDVLPTYCNPRDDRVHAHFNQMGREGHNVVTGRMSSSDPSLQVIPARGDIVSVRCMFVPTVEYPEVEKQNNYYDIPVENEVMLSNGEYQFVSYVKPGDVLETGETVLYLDEVDKKTIRVFVK